MICYEGPLSIDSPATSKSHRTRKNWLVVISNDGWLRRPAWGRPSTMAQKPLTRGDRTPADGPCCPPWLRLRFSTATDASLARQRQGRPPPEGWKRLPMAAARLPVPAAVTIYQHRMRNCPVLAHPLLFRRSSFR